MILASGDCQLRQHGLRPARARRRRRELHGDGEEDGGHLAARALPGLRARRHGPVLHGARDVERLRDDRQRRRASRPDRGQPGRVPRRRGRRARGLRGQPGDQRRRRLHGRRRDEGDSRFGTAAGHGIACPAAGKTGTTEEQSDAWFVGYTPHVSTAVWTGNPDARVPLPGYGADLSAPIWHDYMSIAATEPCEDFPAPEDPADALGLLQRQLVHRRPTRGTPPTTTGPRVAPAPAPDRPPTPVAAPTTTRTSTRPGAGQDARPCSAGRRRRRHAAGAGWGRLATAPREFELIERVRARLREAGADRSPRLALG